MSRGKNPFSLAGKSILVTGASSGIGKQIALSCSEMEASLYVSGRNLSRLQETFDALSNHSGCHHKLLAADLTHIDELKGLVDAVEPLDGVVLCAGMGLTVPVKFASQEKFHEVFETNFFSQVELVRLLYKKKKLKADASVVFLDSIGGTHDISVGAIIYGTSKAALLSATKYFALEFSHQLIRVNCICPGMVETPLIHRGTVTEEQLNADKMRYPLKRYGRPEDIAYMAIYLLSDAASWVTGQDFVIDGGISL